MQDKGIIVSEIQEARESELVKIYTAASDEEFEAAYERYQDILKSIGVEELNAYMTERVAQVKADFGF